jgi:hypothetical protein
MKSTEDKQFAVADGWALASDGIQWILQRHESSKRWRNVSFVRSDRDVLARCLREKGAEGTTIDHLPAGLPDSFEQWKTAQGGCQ